MADDSKLREFTHYNACFDWYQSLFTAKQKALFQAYFHYDLSLQEIADDHHISKAAVSDALRQMKEKLDSLEAQFQFLKRTEAMVEILKNAPATLRESLLTLWQPRKDKGDESKHD
jgi:predicted DNA-binding protein YlxM (UPF0122 family)